MKRFSFKIITLQVLAVLGFLFFGVAIDTQGRPPEQEELAYLPPPAYLRPALLGFESLAADLFWIRTIQYFGKHLETDGRYPRLYQLVDLVISLDPHFIEAYRLGGLFLSYFAREIDHAIALYEKGIEANPDRWELPHDLGRLYYLDLKDYPKALKWWKVADELPGRPSYLPRFVARLQAQTGHVETAIDLWIEIYRSAENEHIRRIALEELRKLGVNAQVVGDGN